MKAAAGKGDADSLSQPWNFLFRSAADPTFLPTYCLGEGNINRAKSYADIVSDGAVPQTNRANNSSNDRPRKWQRFSEHARQDQGGSASRPQASLQHIAPARASFATRSGKEIC
jgi:hypothetical protein